MQLSGLLSAPANVMCRFCFVPVQLLENTLPSAHAGLVTFFMLQGTWLTQVGGILYGKAFWERNSENVMFNVGLLYGTYPDGFFIGLSHVFFTFTGYQSLQ